MSRTNAILLSLVVAVGANRPTPAQTPPDSGATLSACDAVMVVEQATGHVTSIRLGPDAEEMCVPHPAGGDRPYGFVAVVDLHDGRVYNPAVVPSAISDWRFTSEANGHRLTFAQQYEGAPFRLTHALQETPAGIRWDVAVELHGDAKANRSVQVCWMVPLPFGWQFWGPNDTVAHRTDGVTPYRYVYGHTDPAPYGTIIPLVGVWGRRAGAAVFSPPDVRKCQIIFDVPSAALADPPRGVHRHLEDLQMLQVTYHMVGLRPGSPLRLGICLAACRPDWRAVLGHYVASYPELFEPIPAARKFEGMYNIISASRIRENWFERLQSWRVTCLEIHGHFPQYGEYITREALADPNMTWICQPHPGQTLSLASNRRLVERFNSLGIAPFMYFYNVHANAETIEKRFAVDLMRGEEGDPNIQFHGEPALRAQPDSPFGKHLLEQMDMMLQAYPAAPGFFVDNYAIQWVDFAHDDGVTMVHHRPAYDMNRNHQDVGVACIAKAHAAGKVAMVNKLATIESARGVDMVLLEPFTLASLKADAFACVYRAVFPIASGGTDSLEHRMQYLLVWGGTPGSSLPAYRPLTDAMIGKRWVFDPDPVTLPPGFEGQIFRIDQHAPHAGDVVVSLVNLDRSWEDNAFTDGLSVTVRLPEAAQLTNATWLAVEHAAEPPVPCSTERTDSTLRIALPPVGAAGILRLSRQPTSDQLPTSTTSRPTTP